MFNSVEIIIQIRKIETLIPIKKKNYLKINIYSELVLIVSLYHQFLNISNF